MIEKAFAWVFSRMERRRRVALLLTLLVSTLAFFGVRHVPLDTRLDTMLPARGELRQTVRFLQDARFSDKVVISFAFDPAAISRDDFLLAVDGVVKGMGAPFIGRVITDFQGDRAVDDFLFFFRNAAQLLGPEDLKRLDERLAPEAVEASLKRCYMQLVRPEGAFVADMIRSDPIGLRGLVGGNIQRILSSFGFDVTLDRGHIMSRDGRHTMVVLETPVSFTDVAESSRFLDYLEARLAGLPKGVTADVLCGHTHTVSNQRVIVADIQLTAVVESVAFLIMFFVIFRDIAALWIFLIPLVSMLLAVNVMPLFAHRVSALTVGLGGVIAGITVDYGIHIYTAIRRGRNRTEAVSGMVRPILLGAVTLMLVFGAFLISSIEGYRQLGVFSIVGIAFSLVLALFVLPLLVKPGGGMAPGEGIVGRRAPSRTRDWAVCAVFVAVSAAAVVLALRVPFDSDVERLDGTARPILEAERRFRETWGRGESGLGLLVVTGTGAADVAERAQPVYEAAVAAIGVDRLAGFAAVWPSAPGRAENLRRWNEYWRGGNEARLRRAIAEKGPALGFAADAFEPFFESLHRVTEASPDPVGNLIFEQLSERFLRHRGGGEWFQILYFPDRPEHVAALSRIAAGRPGVFLVSREAFTASMAGVFSREVTAVTLLGMALIAIAIFLGLRNVRWVCLALLPVATGGVWLLGVMGLLNYPLTIGNLLAGLLVLGLCIDYGVLMVHGFQQGDARGHGTAVTISAVTSVLGTGALLFARHPALFSVGFTLTVGVIAGYIAAVFVLPGVNRLWRV